MPKDQIRAIEERYAKTETPVVSNNNLGFMYELDAIAACVVGGVSFSGGVGTVIGVVTGVIIFTVINYGLTYIGVNPYWQYISKGAIIIFALALDSMKYARKK